MKPILKIPIKLFFILLFVTISNAQDYKLGKVSIAELEEKKCSIDTTAAAAIIYSKAKTNFGYTEKNGFTIVNEYEYRIKIYKKEGLEWANHKVRYFIGYENLDDDIVKYSNAVTYNLENNQIVKTKLNSEGTFKNNLNEFWGEASITMPNVKVGSIIEYKYIYKSQNKNRFPVFNLQHEIPAKYIEYKTDIPEFYIYKAILTGFLKIKSESKINQTSQNFEDKYHHNLSMDYKQISSSYIAENLPALKDEPYVDNIRNYKTSIIHELERVRMPNQPVKDYTITWEGVANTIYAEKEFGNQLKERAFLETSLRTIIKKDTTQTQKLNSIYNFVKTKMTWDKEYGIYTEKGVKPAFDSSIGNVAEINFILISMLNFAGITANPVLISTVNHGISAYPSRNIFNYVVACAEIDGEKILLDATNKKLAPNILSLECLNWNGRLIRQDGTSDEIPLNPKTPSKKTIVLNVNIDNNGKIEGKIRSQKTNYEAFIYRENYCDINIDNIIEKIENNDTGLQINQYKNNCSLVDYSKPTSEEYDFVSNNQVELIGDKMYFQPMFFYNRNKNPFTQETRNFPIYFSYPKENRYNINIKIPDGYLVETLPKAINLVMPENLGSFKYVIAQNENNIQLIVTETLNESIISADYYESLQDFFKQMVEKENEKLVLKKI